MTVGFGYRNNKGKHVGWAGNKRGRRESGKLPAGGKVVAEAEKQTGINQPGLRFCK